MAEQTLQMMFAGLDRFNEGLNQLATTSAISQANEAAMQIKNEIQNESEQRQALQGVANLMVGRLAQLGTPATTIAQVAQSVGPAPLPKSFEEAFLEGTMTDNKDMLAQAQAGFAAQDQRAIGLFQKETDIKTTAAKDLAKYKAGLNQISGGNFGTDEARKTAKFIFDGFEKFGKNQIEAYDQGRKLMEIVNSVENFDDLGAQGPAVEMLKRFLIKSTGDNKISDSDVKAMKFNPSIANAIKRNFNELIGNRPLSADIGSARVLAQVLAQAAKKALNERIEGYSRSRATALGGSKETIGGIIQSQFPTLEKKASLREMIQKLEEDNKRKSGMK